MPVLIEVNASREAAKSGFAPEQVPALGDLLRRLPHLVVDGLMTMAAYTNNAEDARSTFKVVCQLLDRSNGFPGRQLSMGMSNDFEIAIEEGATLVRIGTTLFEGLPRE